MDYEMEAGRIRVESQVQFPEYKDSKPLKP
jgi:hypothetical protein